MALRSNLLVTVYTNTLYILHYQLHCSEIRTESTSILARTRYQTDIGKICCGQNHMKSLQQPNLPGPFQSGFDFTKMIDWELLIDTYCWHILPIFINTFTNYSGDIGFYSKVIFPLYLNALIALFIQSLAHRGTVGPKITYHCDMATDQH